MPAARTATLIRMVLSDHTCPFGVRAREMLIVAGYEIDEHILSTREEVDAFKAEHGLETTPLIKIDDRPIGGARELELYLSQQPDQG